MADSVAAPLAQRRFLAPSLVVIGALIAAVLGYAQWTVSQSVTALDKRTATIEGSAPDLAGLAGDVAALKTAVGDVATKLGDTPNKLADLSTRIAALEARAPADLTRLTTDLADAKADLATLKAQVGDVAPDKLAALKLQIDDVAARIPPDPGQFAAELAALDGQVMTLQSQLGDLSAAKLATLQTNIDGLSTKVAAIDLAPVNAQLGSVKAQVDALGTQVATLPGKADLATLATQVGAMASRTDLAALQTRLDELAQKSPVAVDVKPIQADIGDLQNRVTALETGGKADVATLATLQSQLDGLTTRVGAVETGTPNADVASMKLALADLKQQIGTLATTGSDVKALQTAVAALQNRPLAPPKQPPKLLMQVYFDRGSYKLGAADAQKLDDLAKDLLANPREVAIMGFTDTQGPAEFNRALSLRRASAVRKALLGHGIDTSTVTALTGLGEDGPPVDTNDDAPEQGNRTVMIFAND